MAKKSFFLYLRSSFQSFSSQIFQRVLSTCCILSPSHTKHLVSRQTEKAPLFLFPAVGSYSFLPHPIFHASPFPSLRKKAPSGEIPKAPFPPSPARHFPVGSSTSLSLSSLQPQVSTAYITLCIFPPHPHRYRSGKRTKEEAR